MKTVKYTTCIALVIFSLASGALIGLSISNAFNNTPSSAATTEMASSNVLNDVIIETETVDAVVTSVKIFETSLGIQKTLLADLYIPEYEMPECITFSNRTSSRNKQYFNKWKEIKDGDLVKVKITTFKTNENKVIKRTTVQVFNGENVIYDKNI